MHQPVTFYEGMPPGTLWANVGQDGVVVLEPYPAAYLYRLPVLIGPARHVQKLIAQWANLHHDGVTRFFGSIAAAHMTGRPSAALDATIEWQRFLAERLAELEAAEAAHEPPEPIGPGVPLA